MDQEHYLPNNNSISFRPDFEISINNSSNDDHHHQQKVNLTCSQIAIDCGYDRKQDHKSSSLRSFSTSTSSSSSGRKSTPEEQLERFEKIYYDNKKYLDTNLSQFLFDITLK